MAAQTGGPSFAVGANPGIEVSQEVQSFSAGDPGYCFIQRLVKLVFGLWTGTERWCVDTEEAEEADKTY